MVALQGYEGPLSWLFLHLLLIAAPTTTLFLVGRCGRLCLWHVAALVLLAALLLLPAVACVRLNDRPEEWLLVMQMHASGSPGVSVFGIELPGWATMLAALAFGCELGVVLFRSGRGSRFLQPGSVAPPADA